MESYRNAYGTPEKQGKASGGDHFIVEDLFDFPNDEDDDTYVPAGDAGHSTESSGVTVVESTTKTSSHELGFPCGDIISGELVEPYDELAELEWLLVEESFSSEDLEKYQLISGMKAASATSSETGEAARPAQFRPDGPVPAKARSKRSRAAPCSWSSRLLALSPSLAITVAAAAAAAAADSSSESELFIPTVPASVRKAPPHERKKDPSAGPAMAPSDGRRCLHCQTDKTPQWRTGPMGPKTLCNACGVRYKSGRLVPEYRPAASPTFSLSKHSNSHRKVLELRRQKEGIDHHHYHQQNQHQQYHHQQYMRYDAAGQPPAGDDYLIHHRTGPDFRQLI